MEDELGDVLLQVLLHSRIAEEAGDFSLADVCRRHREKLQRRHPHVFSDVEVSGVDEVWRNWERIKRGEQGNEGRKHGPGREFPQAAGGSYRGDAGMDDPQSRTGRPE